MQSAIQIEVATMRLRDVRFLLYVHMLGLQTKPRYA